MLGVREAYATNATEFDALYSYIGIPRNKVGCPSLGGYIYVIKKAWQRDGTYGNPSSLLGLICRLGEQGCFPRASCAGNNGSEIGMAF